MYICTYTYICMYTYIVGYAMTNDPTTKECYNKQSLLIKSECCNGHRCYKERRGMLPAGVAGVCAWLVGPSRFD
jgi:hypothetical protein